MAKNNQASRIGTSQKKASVTWRFPLERNDLIFVAVGIGVILLGYLLMFTGVTEEPAVVDGTWNNPLAVVVSPILLVIGYCVIIPLAILKMFRPKKLNSGAVNN